ncbi:diguanylate cyclase [Campylobacter sp. RM9344]|uniref:Diguanylate cyclase n=1 Tax=Campylobacter californiensis TaxID=1032243 RepID=A0AAW3ZV37_9BACT|nr:MULTISPECIES: diguanylate cyclase [unclassified Campylobacter]MBE2984566.1 diguanylate cyclase [Campylobacter sp. RM6883]MBE2987033.1 diguanylate cyclase [Campylobacter sp. RM12919]MBE2988680.1 diguanylate cyclase [Campylobacter sp. RM12920]MBE2995146.1 diguanylate cyclase [Campylobacter sp. RM6913]MBE3029067.1 diguanylate cyclase [Campylobacter sp. RM9344]
MIKIDSAPAPENKMAIRRPGLKKKNDINEFSESVLRGLAADNVPSIPSNYLIYFEKMLDDQPEEFKKHVGEAIQSQHEGVAKDIESNFRIEKEVRQSLMQIKGMLQSIALIYKNLNVMKGIMRRHVDSLDNNVNLLAVQNVLNGFNSDLSKLNNLMDKHIEVIKANYEEIGKMFKVIEERSIHDIAYDVYNKKFFISTLQDEIDAVKRYGYNSSFLFLKVRDEFLGQVKSLKEQNNIFKTIAQLLLRTSRRSDIVAHYGDGCFAMVMKYTDENGAKLACSRIASMLSNVPCRLGDSEYKLDVQIVASLLSKNKTIEETVSRALDKLYENSTDEQPVFLTNESE